MSITIYHNPRCSKSRQALALIEQRGSAPEIIDYQQAGLHKEELNRILLRLNAEAREIIRVGDKRYVELGLDDARLTQDQLLNALIEHPALLQRPIVLTDAKAVIARPPEKVLTIL